MTITIVLLIIHILIDTDQDIKNIDLECVASPDKKDPGLDPGLNPALDPGPDPAPDPVLDPGLNPDHNS